MCAEWRKVSWQDVYSCPWKESRRGQTSSPYGAPIQAGGQGPTCVTPHIPFKCTSHRTPSSCLSNAEGGPGGGVLGCTTSPPCLSRVYEAQKCPSLTTWLWAGPQQRNSSVVLKLGQGNEYTPTPRPPLSKCTAEPATCKALGSKLSHLVLKSHN